MEKIAEEITEEIEKDIFDIPIDLGNKIVTFRKWKGLS